MLGDQRGHLIQIVRRLQRERRGALELPLDQSRERAGARSNSASQGTTSSGSPPITAAIPLDSSAQAAAISRPRTPASATASSAVNTPAIAAAASSPTE